MARFDNKSENSMSGKLLVALPSLHSSCFEKSVIYMCNHDSNGAMGIIINHALNNLDFHAVLKQFNIKSDLLLSGNLPVHFGGPVDMVRGFILHTSDYHIDDTFNVDDKVCLTSSTRILRDITSGSGPKKSILALGYAGWEAGQLEQEIKRGSWYTVPATEDIIFGDKNEDKWRKAARLAGIHDPLMFSHEVGHA